MAGVRAVDFRYLIGAGKGSVEGAHLAGGGWGGGIPPKGKGFNFWRCGHIFKARAASAVRAAHARARPRRTCPK